MTGFFTVDALFAGQWGVAGEAFHHLVLPALVLAAFNVSLLARYTRSSVLEVMGNDYVRAARAKGLPEPIVLWRYVLRAALPAIVTVIGLALREHPHRGRPRREHLRLARDRPVRLPGRHQPRPARDHGRQPLRRRRLRDHNFVVDVLYGVIDPRIRMT